MRNYRERSDTVRRVTLITLCYLATLSSLTSASTTISQKIGFAGGLKSEENSRERSPVFSATSTNYHPSDFHNFEDHNRAHHPNHHSHEDFRSTEKQLGRIQYNKLPSYGPRSQSEYDNPRKYTNSVSPYKKLYTVAASPSPTPSVDYNDIDRNHNHHTPQPEPKKYAFAYAVRDGYRGDDYSHKESRDGKVTMGEYKVLLPDGRLQVVRYTADALAGFKADVTYEGEETPPHLMPKSTPKPTLLHPSKSPYHGHGQPSSAVHKKYILPSPSPPQRSDSLFVSNPLRSRPSLSPSIIYADSEHQDDHYVIHRSIPGHGNGLGYSPNSIQASPSASPSPHPIIYKLSPTPYTFKKQLSAPPSPTFSAFHKNPINIGPTKATYYNPSSTPKNIYEKILASPSPSNFGPTKEPYSAIPRGYRAGPSPTASYKKVVPLYKVIASASPSPTPIGHGHGHRKIINVVSSPSPGEPFTRKSRLIPVELFKAGPLKDPYNPHRQGHGQLISPDYESNSHPQHYILEHDDHQVEEHHNYPRHYNSHNPQEYTHPQGIAPIKSSLATFLDKATFGHVTPKPALYIKSTPTVGVGRAIQPSVSGLVYLETPGQGARPNSLGVKELLDRIPHGNLPLQKTTTHPYEIGSKDYGSEVSYGNSNSNSGPTIGIQKASFIPSQQIPDEYLPRLETDKFRHYSGEYLTDGRRDSRGPPEY